MLKETRQVKQVPGERRRRWFSDEVMDLTVWFDEREAPAGFELCYDKGKNERALRWSRTEGFLHERVDDGEGRPGRHKSSPVLLPDGQFDAAAVLRRFSERSREMDPQIAVFVQQALQGYPRPPGP